MEIEVNEYVRNEDGYIWQIKKTKDLDNIFIDEDGKVKEIAGETVFGDDIIVEITKHSRDIIDLVEVGDLIKTNEEKTIIHIYDIDVLETVKEDIEEGHFTIESIVTHEMYASIEYKVEEDK